MEEDWKQRQHAAISPGHHLFQGTAFVFLADALFPLTGIVTAAFLTRSLGARDYGLFTLTAVLISWVEIALAELFSRATIKIVGETRDWQSPASSFLRLYLLAGLGAMVACWAAATPCALLLGEPKLAIWLAIYAIDIPISALATCHRSILVGRGGYNQRAVVSAGRWISRLVLILVLVQAGLSIPGAICGLIGASVVELSIARHYVQPHWPKTAVTPVSLWSYAIPIFLTNIILRFMNLDLFLLKSLGGSAEQAGIYGASQNVSFIMPGIFAAAFSPLLLSTITRVRQEKEIAAAKTLGLNAIRVIIILSPLAIVAAAESNGIAILLFGSQFANSGPLIAILVFAGLAVMSINLLSSVLVAWEKPALPFKITAPLLPLAIAGHLYAIPRFGPRGAASVTAIVTGLGAFACIVAVYYTLKSFPPFLTLLRALIVSGMAYVTIRFWHSDGLGIIVEMAVAMTMILAGFVLLGEFRRHEIRFMQDVFRHSVNGKWRRERP